MRTLRPCLILFSIVLVGTFLSAQTEQPAKPPAQKTSPRTPTAQTPTGTTARRPVGSVTFAVAVADPAGGPIGDVKVTVQGAATREARTENGRLAFENLPVGAYRLRFEHEGFVTLERELAGHAGAPMDVKVTLTPAPEPPKPPPPAPVAVAPPPAPIVKAETVALDISSFLDKNFVGRAASKNSNLGCSGGGTATLMQFRDSISEHTHADADEYIYIIAGTGSARLNGNEQPLQPSVFLQIPRSVPHVLTNRGKNPIVLLSIKAGEPCRAATTTSQAGRQ